MGYSPEMIHFETWADLDPEPKKLSEHGASTYIVLYILRLINVRFSKLTCQQIEQSFTIL